MKTVLFCWELGANFGHLAAMAAIRDPLEAAGFELIYAVADLAAATEMLGSEAPLVQAPVWPRYTHRGNANSAVSFADVLTHCGFGQSDSLGVLVGAWLRLFDLTGSELIVSDHSPAAQIAAQISARKLVTFGTGFTMPPLGYPEFPLLRPDYPPAMPEQFLWQSAANVAASRGLAPIPATLPGFFVSDARIIIGLPELDPYQSFRREPLFAPPGGFPAPSPVAEMRVFAYLGNELPNLEERVQTLCDLHCPVEFHIRGGDPLLNEFIRLRGKTAHVGPADTKDVLARASHVVSQGGAMMASMALAAGRPHLMLPLHGETRLNASLVCRLGAGVESQSNSNGSQFSHDVSRFLADRKLEDRAQNAGKLLATRPLPDSGVEAVAVLQGLAAR